MDTYGMEIKKSISEADAVIVGIGSELAADIDAVIEENEVYRYCKKYMAADDECLKAYVKYSIFYNELSNGKNKIINAYALTYRKVSALLLGKRYFVLTTNTDNIIYEGGFDEGCIAAPCGSIFRLQNGCGCMGECQSAEPVLEEIYNILLEQMNKQESCLEKIREIIPKCHSCNTLKVFNIHGENKYDESGYMQQWEKYTKWLQLTLNKKLVLLELGVGFDAPTVIRWPFEKIAMLNYKAWLYRINGKLPQLPAELKDKGTSVNENSYEFINANF